MKAIKRKKRGNVIFPKILKDYSILELIELGEKNNKIELADSPKKSDSTENKGNSSSKKEKP